MSAVPPFVRTLAASGQKLVKAAPLTLQVNTGYLCNLACRHCHLQAGPKRTEVMERATMEAVADTASRMPFETIDITGGAPEMVPDIAYLLGRLAPLAPNKLFRTNLLALRERAWLLDVLTEGGWSLVASLPAVNEFQVRSMRGDGVFAASLEMLSRLNAAGYGRGGGLELHLVSNPGGAFLPPDQQAAEKLFRRELTERRGIAFTSLYVFANMALGRFEQWLKASGNEQAYRELLYSRFNPAVVDGLMCRTIVSVAYDGTLYDCDFNQAAGLPAAFARHVSELPCPVAGAEIAVGEHCYACTAGSGFT